MTATIGQTRYLSSSGVGLPGEPMFLDESSDYIAEVRFGLSQNLNFDFGHQWGTQDRGTTQSQARLQYRPASNKIFNLSYRFRRDSLEQGDVSWSWPIASQWNVVGRYKYSFRDEEALEEFLGIGRGLPHVDNAGKPLARLRLHTAGVSGLVNPVRGNPGFGELVHFHGTDLDFKRCPGPGKQHVVQ